MPCSWWQYYGAFLILFLTRKVLAFRANSNKLSNVPGIRALFSPFSPLGALLPTSRLNPGLNWLWLWRDSAYTHYGLHTMTLIPYLMGPPSFYTRSLTVARQVISPTSPFIKPEDTSKPVLLWGPNLSSENGTEWKRHRRIMAPAFNPNINKRVWAEAVDLYRQMLQAEGWADKDELYISAMNEITTKFSLFIIARCGLDQPLMWKTVDNDTASMSFSEALAIVSTSAIARLIIPRWMYHLPIKRLRDMETAYTSLAEFMRNLIESRKAELAGDGTNSRRATKDVFRLMIEASESEGDLRLSDEELMGNTFLMLIAGHDTTAKALDATIGFLALYDEIQEEAYQEVCAVMSSGGDLRYDDYSRLKTVLGCFLEGARLFPAVLMMIRESTDTVILKTDEEDGHDGHIVLEPGIKVAVDVIGLHHNPKNFPEPEEFRPSRWYDASQNDMTMFSFGPRACIGRGFALAEGVAFLSHLLRDWKLHVVLEPGETRAQWRKRVMVGSVGFTFGVGKVPVRLTRR